MLGIRNTEIHLHMNKNMPKEYCIPLIFFPFLNVNSFSLNFLCFSLFHSHFWHSCWSFYPSEEKKVLIWLTITTNDGDNSNIIAIECSYTALRIWRAGSKCFTFVNFQIFTLCSQHYFTNEQTEVNWDQVTAQDLSE